MTTANITKQPTDRLYVSMEPLHYVRDVLLLSLILTVTHIRAHNIRVTCSRSNLLFPEEWLEISDYNPSPLHALDLRLVQESRSQKSLFIQWSIKIDILEVAQRRTCGFVNSTSPGSTRYITGTWISLNEKINYKCQYEPSFTLNRSDHSGLNEFSQISFNFTINDIHVTPRATYRVTAYNLPTTPDNAPGQLFKFKMIEVPGCNDERMKMYPECSERNSKAHLENFPAEKKVNIAFTSHPYSVKYRIRLIRDDSTILDTEVLTNRVFANFTETLSYSGPCSNLIVKITPHYDDCTRYCQSEQYDVPCEAQTTAKPSEVKTECTLCGTTILVISIGCATAALMMACLCLTLRMRRGFLKHRPASVSTDSVGVLMVYPAVDSPFQHAVMTLADFLQGHGSLKVVIDMWQRGSLAKQGPLRWLNLQVDCAEKVLFVLPPQHSTSTNSVTGSLRTDSAPGTAGYTVPASAPELFSMALNLVASTACNPQSHSKFWVVHLSPSGEKSDVPVELRGCKDFQVPKDLQKLHRKLTSTKRPRGLKVGSSLWTLGYSETSRKVKEAVLQLNKGQLHISKEELVGLTKL